MPNGEIIRTTELGLPIVPPSNNLQGELEVLRGVLHQLIREGHHRSAKDVLETINTVQRLETKTQANPTRTKQEILTIIDRFFAEVRNELPDANLCDARKQITVELRELRNGIQK